MNQLNHILDTYYQKYKDIRPPEDTLALYRAIKYFWPNLPLLAKMDADQVLREFGDQLPMLEDFREPEQVLKATKMMFSELFEGKAVPSAAELFPRMLNRIKKVISSRSPYHVQDMDISDITWLLANVYPDTFLWYDQTTLEAANYLNLWPTFNRTDNYAERYKRFMDAMQPVVEWFKTVDAEPFYLNLLLIAIYHYEVQNQEHYSSPNTLHASPDRLVVEHFLSVDDELKITDLSSREIYLVGENGTGKTVLLQSLLIAFKEHAIREQSKQDVGVILDLIDKTPAVKKGQPRPVIQGTIRKELHEKGIYKHDKSEYLQKLYIKSFYAYGVYRNQRASQTEKDPYGYLSLFTQNFALRDPVEWLRQLKFNELEAKEKGEQLSGITLDKAIQLLEYLLDNAVTIQVEAKKVTFKEKQTGVSFNELADGYKTVMIWTVDMLSRLMEDQPHAERLEDFRATVLVDEVDMFLHPTWAYHFMYKLRKHFKRIQFIVTTHNPILLLGASKNALFYKIYKENGATRISEPIKDIRGLSANSLITSPLWGLSDFTTKGTQPEQITSDDYPYWLIHEELEKRIKENPGITEEELKKIVRQKLDELKNK